MPTLTNLHDTRRFRLELPTGETRKKNGEEIPVKKIVWLVGRKDAGEVEHDGKKIVNSNSITLSKDEAKYVQTNEALQDLIHPRKPGVSPTLRYSA